jgi:Na+/proline symporter
MQLSILDISVIVIYMILMLGIGIFYRKSASENISSYFLGGRNIPWWLAGSSMIATTFAADTPLAVAELVTRHGIAGNWLWWNFLIGGMLTTFFFAKLWRKANILTDLEFIELRYSGKQASFLRGFRAAYLGVLMNAIIIGWVNVALVTIIEIFFGIPHEYSLLFVALSMIITVIYSSLSGFLGVAITDFIQFVLAMGGTIILAIVVLNDPKIGGISGLKAQLPSWSLDFFPKIGSSASVSDVAGAFTLSLGTFLAYISMQWWASWYPAAEPGGGGYIAQRMMSTKNEQHAIAGTLFYQIFHYCIRPWPWIIVGLCVLVLYPDLPSNQKKVGYVLVMRDYLPAGLKGLLLMAFFAAYMSTISSQFNWGASYLVNDLYKRFYKPKASQKELVNASRWSTVIMMIVSLAVTPLIKSIAEVWEFVIECGAGLGLVLILRWYWWRINAWSEIVATIVPFIIYSITHFVLAKSFPDCSISHFPGSFFLTVGLTTISWLVVTFVTKGVDPHVLQEFYKRIKPYGYWKPIRESLGMSKNEEQNTKSLLICWISSVTMTYGILFFIGYLIFRQWNNAFVMLSVISGSFVILAYHSKKNKIFHDTEVN